MVAVGAFIAGLLLLIVGAELLTRGGTRLAAMLGISPLVIGITVVSIGTSMPELAIGIEAGLSGSGELAIGNIAGTNIVNILLILGIISVLKPLRLESRTIRYDLPGMVIAAVLLLALALDGLLSRWDGIVLTSLAVVYSVLIVVVSRKESRAVRRAYALEYAETPPEATTVARTNRAIVVSLIALVSGIAIIVLGADWLVDGASEIARMVGASEELIGLTIVAIGTSAPELVTAVVSTMRGDRRIAVGNLIGSSVYNLLLILGVTATVPTGGIPVSETLRFVDIPIMAAVSLICVPIFASGRRISRLEGALMVAAYAAYLSALLIWRI